MGFCTVVDSVWAQSHVGQGGPGLYPLILLEENSARGALVYLLRECMGVPSPYQSR